MRYYCTLRNEFSQIVNVSIFNTTPHARLSFRFVFCSKIRFPTKTPGTTLDVIARQYLWSSSSDYAHGTGHGVGASLSVHEGPQGISKAFANRTPLDVGMIVSNEPGYYDEKEGFGIRIENLIEVVEAETGWLKFDTLTMIPIQRELIDVTVMDKSEIEWINDYHAKVWDRVGKLLEDGSQAKEWLFRYTRAI